MCTQSQNLIIVFVFQGFAYLISKYAEDFGLVQEPCFPYKGQDAPCQEKKCVRQFGTGYHYVGGFYGACNEVLMRLELVNNGPIAVGFEVYNDFVNYKSGIYHHTGKQKDPSVLEWHAFNSVLLEKSIYCSRVCVLIFASHSKPIYFVCFISCGIN